MISVFIRFYTKKFWSSTLERKDKKSQMLGHKIRKKTSQLRLKSCGGKTFKKKVNWKKTPTNFDLTHNLNEIYFYQGIT